MPRLDSGAEIHRPEITETTPPLIPEVVWQQTQETQLSNIHKIASTETHKNTHMPEFKQRNNVESQMSPMQEASPQVAGSSNKPLTENITGSRPVQCLIDSKQLQPDIQRTETNMTANDNRGGGQKFPSQNNNSTNLGATWEE